MSTEKISKDMLVSQITNKYPQTLDVFYKFDIDACCWADNSLELAAEDRGADVNELLEELNKVISRPVPKEKDGGITAKMNVGELLKKYPESAEILFEKGLHCLGCHVSLWENLEEAAAAHGIVEEEFEKLLKELNKAIKK